VTRVAPTMSYSSRALFSSFTRTRISHILTKASHRRTVLLLLLLLSLFSIFPSNPILPPPTLTPITQHPVHHEQADDQFAFRGQSDISSSASATARTWSERAQTVKAAFLHAYAGYNTYAFGKDELRSLSNTSVNKYGSRLSNGARPTNSLFLLTASMDGVSPSSTH